METRITKIGGRGMRLVVFWFVVILAVIVDQATKAVAERSVMQNGSYTLIPGVLDVTLVRNAGAAFSFGQGGGIVFIIVALVFLGGAMYLVWSNEDMPLWLVIPIGLVAGGGMGNMVDRLIEGKVIDFLATTFIDFPVFNVADICVTVGIVVSIIAWWTWDTRREREAEGRTNTVRPNGQGNV